VAVLTEAQGREALRLARASLESWVRSRKRVEPPGGLPTDALGAFVSLHTKGGALRGCIGHMQGQMPLAEEIIELAIAAGTHDPRFDAVTAAELPGLVYEISVLSPMKRAKAAEVQPGTHGLMIRKGGRSGVLLPQVATEYGWDRETFLQHTCEKAGLPPDAWRDADTEISTFTAQVVSEA
jgi:AmmeMemoRadiSam system protein A